MCDSLNILSHVHFVDGGLNYSIAHQAFFNIVGTTFPLLHLLFFGDN